jgi:nicotinamidase/pyrazinamidase
VDAQNTFTPLCEDELPVPGGDEIGAALNAQANYAHWRIGSKDAHSPQAIWVANASLPALTPLEGENVDLAWPLHAVPGTRGFELLAELPSPKDYDFFVWKGVEPDMHPYGALYHDLQAKLSTGVIEFLRMNHIDSVLIGGLALDFCVKVTALQLARVGIRVVVNLAACKGLYPDTCLTAKEEMRAAGIHIIDNLNELSLDYAD